MQNEKHPLIHDVVHSLRNALGDNAFVLVDYWEADLCAIAVAHPDNHAILVYISTCALPEKGYYAELELPPLDEDMPYHSAGEYDDLTLDALTALIKHHLKLT